MLTTSLHAQRVYEAVLSFDNAEFFRVTELRTSYVYKAVSHKSRSHCFLVPHPSVNGITKPTTQETSSFHFSHSGFGYEAHSIPAGRVIPDDNLKIWNDQTEKTPRSHIRTCVGQRPFKPIEGEVLKDVGGINPHTTAFINRKPLDDISITHVLGKVVEGQKQPGTGIEINPAIWGAKSATVLHIHSCEFTP